MDGNITVILTVIGTGIAIIGLLYPVLWNMRSSSNEKINGFSSRVDDKIDNVISNSNEKILRS